MAAAQALDEAPSSSSAKAASKTVEAGVGRDLKRRNAVAELVERHPSSSAKSTSKTVETGDGRALKRRKVATAQELDDAPLQKRITRSSTKTASKDEEEPEEVEEPRVDDDETVVKGVIPGKDTMTGLTEGQCWSTVYGVDGKPIGVGIVGQGRSGIVVMPEEQIDLNTK